MKFSLSKLFIGICIALSKYQECWALLKICGDPSAVNTCKAECNRKCIDESKSNNIYEWNVKDSSLALNSNICISNCDGNSYNPRKSLELLTKKTYTDKDWPWTQYTEIQGCLGRCKHPAPDYCLSGYLSAFLFCDCHTCCKQNQDLVRAQVCVIGCHDWFLRQWSPQRNEGCRFPAALQYTPTAWCEAFCSWQFLKLSSPNSTSDPSTYLTSKEGKHCTGVCKYRVENGITIDYDTIIEPCRVLEKCVTVTMLKYKITTAISKEQLNSLRHSHDISFRRIIYNNTKGQLSTTEDKTKIPCEPSGTFKKRSSLLQMSWEGARIEFDENVEKNTEATNDPAGLLPKMAIGALLSHSLNKETPKKQHYDPKYCVRVELDKCSRFSYSPQCIAVRYLELEIQVIFKVSDTQSFKFGSPMKSKQLREAISGNSEYSNLVYIKDEDEYTIIMEEKIVFVVEFGVEAKMHQIECTRIPECVGGPTPAKCTCTIKSNENVQNWVPCK